MILYSKWSSRFPTKFPICTENEEEKKTFCKIGKYKHKSIKFKCHKKKLTEFQKI